MRWMRCHTAARRVVAPYVVLASCVSSRPHAEREVSLTPLLVLSKPNPLRWASVWLETPPPLEHKGRPNVLASCVSSRPHAEREGSLTPLQMCAGGNGRGSG